MKKKVVVVGSYNTDLTIRSKRIPRPGETILGGSFFQGGGGKGANQAVACARAGAEVSFLARLGTDPLGDAALERLKQDGIATHCIVRDKEYPTGVAFILVDEQGENRIVVASGANARLSPTDIEQAKDEITSAGVLLLQLECPLETVRHAIHLAHQSGTLVILNPAPAEQLNGLCFEKVDILTPNRVEAEKLSGAKLSDDESLIGVAQKILDLGAQNVLITLGAKGVFAASKGAMHLVPAVPVQAIDSTGAGDIFSGSLAAFLAEGKSIDESVKMAMAAASISVTRLGAQSSAPLRANIEQLLSSRSVSKIDTSN
jgi:ribokinase